MNRLCVVLISPGHPVDRRKVREMLWPYSEKLPVDCYEEKCWCIGAMAFAEAEEAADTELARAEGERYVRILRLETPDPDNDFSPEEKREIEELEARHEAIRDRHEKAHPLHNKPLYYCETCEGTGTDKGFYNPLAEFSEWWMERLPPRRGARLPVGELLREIEKYPPIWAVVTPQGRWRQRRSLPRKKRESDEGYERRNAPLRQEWERELEAILKGNQDCMAVSVGYRSLDDGRVELIHAPS